MEKLEDKKNRMKAENEEVTSKKLKRTTEHGQILMSIDNIFRKCLLRPDLLSSMKEFKPDSNFDDMHLSAKWAVDELTLIKQSLKNFITLNTALKTKESV